MDTIPSPPAPPGAASPISEDALDGLLRQIIEGYFVLTDGQGAISKWSDPAELLFGYQADDALMEPFFGKLVPPAGLSPEGESWRAFLEQGGNPGVSGRLRVDAHRPGGAGTFAMDAVFIPVKLDEGFDFSLFLEDLGFELPMDMMLLRMRQQHPVVVRALRTALEAAPQPWEGVRTAGTLIAFRPLEPTPWMDQALAVREAETAEAEAEMSSRIEALEAAPSVTGTDVYDLDDARAVIDRLRWATERIGELEERSRIADAAVADAADARVRAEAAERAALDVRAEVSGVLAERPVDATSEADRLELLARLERIERSAMEAAEAASAQRLAAEAERARTAELEAQRAELIARLEHVERAAGSTSVAEAAIADARAELTARMEALERNGAGGAATDVELVARLEHLERARLQEAEELREEIGRVRALADVRGDVETLHGQVAELSRLREELLTLNERADAQSAVIRRGEEREAAAIQDVHAAREELAGALGRIESLSEETARIRAHLGSTPQDVGLSGEDRHRLELATAGVHENRTGIEAIRALAEDLREQSAELREEGGRLQARLVELADADEQARRDRDGLRRDQEALRAHLDELRTERESVRSQLREAARAAEEARSLAEEAGSGIQARPPASAEEVLAARARMDELTLLIGSAESRIEDALSEAAGARAEVEDVRQIAGEAQHAARDAGERAEMADRATQNLLTQLSTQAAIIEEVGALARSAQVDASESRADAGEARTVVARLETMVAGVREQLETTVADVAGAREQAAAAGEAAAAVRQMSAGIGDTAREAAAKAVEPLTDQLVALRAALEGAEVAISELRTAPGADLELEAAVDELQADVRALRMAMENAEGGDAAAVQAVVARLDAVEETVPKGLDARLESLREGLSGALGRLESVSVDVAAARTETGAGRQAIEQRLADSAAELMVARTDAEQARRGLDALREELASLREYAAAAKAEAAAAKEAAANARRAGAGDDRQLDELRTDVQAALAKFQEFKTGFEEARQAAVAARRDAEQARKAAEKAGSVNEVTTEKFTEVWQRMLTSAPANPDRAAGTAPGRSSVSKPKPAPSAREPEAGFDDDTRPVARLDLKGKFTQLNPAFTKLVGYQEHEFGKATWPSVLDRKTYQDSRAELDGLIAGNQTSVVVDSTYMHGQGLMVRIRGALTLVRDASGAPDHLLMVAEPGGPSAD